MATRDELELNTQTKDRLSSFFANKDLYDSVFTPTENKSLFSPVDLNIFYGKVDGINNSIIFNQDFLGSISIDEDVILCCDIVAKAFSDMRNYVIKAQPFLEKNSVYYNLKPVSGFESVHQLYVDYLNNFYSSLASFIDRKMDKKIKSARDFFDIFIEVSSFFIKDQNSPLTRTGFINSIYCPPTISGLILDIGSEEINDDQTKYDTYIKDLNFEFYLATAKKFNFLVDKEKPWRLIFNLRSTSDSTKGDKSEDYDNLFSDIPLQDCGIPLRDKGYLKLFGLNSLNDFFNTRYYKSMIGLNYPETTELESLKIVFMQMYNTYIIPNKEFTFGKDYGKEEVKILKNIRPTLYTEDLQKQIPEELWIKTLLYFRGLESNQKWNQTEFETFYKKSLVLYNAYGIRNSINYINSLTKNISDLDKTSSLVVNRQNTINLVNSEPESFRF